MVEVEVVVVVVVVVRNLEKAAIGGDKFHYLYLLVGLE